MDIDSSPPHAATFVSPRDRIIQRLTLNGIPGEYLEGFQPGLVGFVKNNRSKLPDIVSTILLIDSDVSELVTEPKSGLKKALSRPTLIDEYRESMLWLKWLMFEGDPCVAMEKLAQMSGQRGVCGAVWGKNDLAFRCRTCEHDPTCAICVPCFQNGNHKNHDYSIIYTGGGCCDCGDETAWKREGFCSKHKGAEQMQPLPEEMSNTVGPVLDILFMCWQDILSVAETALTEDSSAKNHSVELRKLASELTHSVVEMLLEFCKHSESLLGFVSKRLLSIAGLLDLLVRSERFLSIEVTNKLHELLLKLLGDPAFKFKFARVFIEYYRVPVGEVLRVSSDTALKKFPLLSMFGVQIFTVPTLTPRLVKEWDLLDTLLDCLGEILFFCCENGRLEFSKWVGVFDTCIRVMEDIRFVLSHSSVAKYVTQERIDIIKAWLQILFLVQGINPQKRQTGIHIEEENENARLPFLMCNCIANIHLLLIKGAFSVTGNGEIEEESSFKSENIDFDDGFSQRHAKVGRLSEESSVCSAAAQSSVSDSVTQKFDGDDQIGILNSVSQLMFEALRAIDCWLTGSPVIAHGTNSVSHSSVFTFKKASLDDKKGKHMSAFYAGDMDYSASTVETETPREMHTFALLSLSHWSDINYDVSSQEVSVHMPLHVLLSLILKDTFRTYCGDYMVTDKDGFGSLTSSSDYHDFFKKILRGCHPYGFSSFLMEHPLQSRVFCSQVRAGMWRKNGDAAAVCFECYRSTWCDHALELDLFLLQICAALAPADLYLRRVLDRFQLLSFLDLDLKRSSEYEPVLVEEMLSLIIQIVKERRFSGLKPSENLERVLVCKLATGDATHSQLVKSLPRDLSKLNQLQEVLDKVAQYSNPSGMNQGKYSLRLPYWKELDLYHPCWNPRELQVAEERYSRYCGVSALSSQLPKWSDLYKPLIGIARIATCETVLQIIRAALFYHVVTDKSSESRAPDGVLICALHLLSLGLDICCLEKKHGQLLDNDQSSAPLLNLACEEIGLGMYEYSGGESLVSLLVLLMRRHKRENIDSFMEAGNFNLSSLVDNLLKKLAELDSKCMKKLQQLAPEVINYQVDQTNNSSSASDTEKRKLKARERQAAILAKMKAEQSKFMANLKSASDTLSDDSCFEKEDLASDATQQSLETHICCLCHDFSSKSPVSFLILLQKSRLANFVDRGPPSWDQDLLSDGSRSSFAANERISPSRNTKAVSVETITSSQWLPLVQGAIDEFSYEAHPAELNAFKDYIKSQFPELRNLNIPEKYGDQRDKIVYSLELFEQDVSFSIQKEMINIANVSNSKRDGKGVIVEENVSESCYPDTLLLGKYISALTKGSKDSSQNNNSRKVESSGRLPVYDRFGPSDCDGIHVSSCGHAVHQGCLDRYLSSLKERSTRRMIFEGGHIVDPDQGEFLCPVCRRLANCTLPAAPSDSHKLWEQPMQLTDHSSKSSGSLAVTGEENTFRLQHALSLLQSAASVVSRGETLKSLPMQQSRRIRPNLEPLFQMLKEMYFPGKQDILVSGRISPSIIMWDTLKYSLVSTEIASHCGKTCLTARKGISSLFSEYRSSGGFVLPLLLRVIQSSRSNNLPDALLRLRGIKLFAASICSGVNCNNRFRAASNKEGKIMRILKQTNSEMIFPDTLFWDQASDPVLIQDPFGSLMWCLYCLPYPFLSSRECFFSLVHLFYAVVIAQAVITYCAYTECNMSELGFHDCVPADIAYMTRKSKAVKQCFISNYVDPSCHMKDVVQNLSLPYLRRCALLWKLLKSCSAFQFPSRVDDIDKLLDISDSPEFGDIQETNDEFRELQNMFALPSLDVIFKDEVLRLVILKWFHHFSEEFDDHSVPRALYSTPAVPFKLMHLPHVYQDLVQRYIKPRCLDCKLIQDDPALCLLCGRLCSPAWKSCCRESGCQTHAMACGAGTGIFLLIRKTNILLQRNARQAPWPSPYLDAFGEEDIDMRRGKPLFLNEERYAALTYMVASHGLDRSSKVLRQATIGAFFMF